MTTDSNGQTDFQVPAHDLSIYFSSLLDYLQASQDEAVEDILMMLKKGQTIPSQEHLARRWGRPKQTVSDWLCKWRGEGVIPEPTQVGRCKAMVPNL